VRTSRSVSALMSRSRCRCSPNAAVMYEDIAFSDAWVWPVVSRRHSRGSVPWFVLASGNPLAVSTEAIGEVRMRAGLSGPEGHRGVVRRDAAGTATILLTTGCCGDSRDALRQPVPCRARSTRPRSPSLR
jgi:hypothetical protein